MSVIPFARHKDANHEGIGYDSVNITTNTTTTVKSKAGVIHTLSINTAGATSNTVKLYDGAAATGTLLGTWDTTTGVTFFLLDIYCGTNITAVTAAGTAADITITYS